MVREQCAEDEFAQFFLINLKFKLCFVPHISLLTRQFSQSLAVKRSVFLFGRILGKMSGLLFTE